MTKNHVKAHFSSEGASASLSRVLLAPPSQTSSPTPAEETLTPDTQDSELFRMADAASAVSGGSLEQIGRSMLPENPVLQCVQIKPMASQNGNERYRVVMNDTQNFIQGMLGQRECM